MHDDNSNNSVINNQEAIRESKENQFEVLYNSLSKSKVSKNIFLIINLRCLKVKIKEKSYWKDCVQPLPSALSESRQIMQ